MCRASGARHHLSIFPSAYALGYLHAAPTGACSRWIAASWSPEVSGSCYHPATPGYWRL